MERITFICDNCGYENAWIVNTYDDIQCSCCGKNHEITNMSIPHSKSFVKKLQTIKEISEMPSAIAWL